MAEITVGDFKTLKYPVIVALTALLSVWWQSDIDTKKVYTKEWHDRVEEHVRNSEILAVESQLTRHDMTEIKNDVKDLRAQVETLSKYIYRQQGLKYKDQ